MSDKLNQESTDEALGKAVDAEEYEREGRKVKRNLREIRGLRDELRTEDRVREHGNILARAQHGAVRRG